MNVLKRAVDSVLKRNENGYPIPTEDLEMAKQQQQQPQLQPQTPPSIEMTDETGNPQTAEVDLTESDDPGLIRKSSLSAAFEADHVDEEEEEEEEEEESEKEGPFSAERGFKNPFETLFPNFQWPFGLTNFHVSLIVGVIGFFIFWLGLLLRIYLPHDYFSS